MNANINYLVIADWRSDKEQKGSIYPHAVAGFTTERGAIAIAHAINSQERIPAALGYINARVVTVGHSLKN